MKKYIQDNNDNNNEEATDVLSIRQVIHSIECDSCDRVMLPKQNKTYYEIYLTDNESDRTAEFHLCSTYCLNKKVAEISIDGSIRGIRFEKLNLSEVNK